MAVVSMSPATGVGAGEAISGGISKGIVKGGAIAGAVATVTSKAADAIGANLGAAINRFDTLNAYPKVMESLGYGADSVSESLSKMDSRLQGMPTSLNEMVSLVQGLVTSTNDLSKATDVGLALNDMLVASGSSAQLTSAAMEQFRQILAKGKPEMQDWRSLTSAMPGQMDQLAKSMLGPTANANDLYAALGGGKNEATLSIDDLLDAMVRLDTEGGDGIASFAEQAKSASGGIQTSMANIGTAFSRGIAGVLDAIGKDTISDALGGVKDAVNAAFGAVNAAAPTAASAAKGLGSVLAEAAPSAAAAGAAIAGVTVAADGVAKAAPKVKAVAEALKLAAGGAGTFQEALALAGVSFNPVLIGLSAVAAGVAVFGVKVATNMRECQERTDNMRKATVGLQEAVKRTASLSEYGNRLDSVGDSAGFSALSVSDLAEQMAKSADAASEAASKAEGQITTLNTAKGIIDEYAGRTDLSNEAQGKLAWAIQQVNEQLGLSISANDVATNSYRDQNGEVQNLKASIDDLVEAKKREIQQNQLTDQLTQAYKDQAEAAKTYAQARRDAAGVDMGNSEDAFYMSRLDENLNAGMSYDAASKDAADQRNVAIRNLQDAGAAYESATAAVDGLTGALGDSSKAASSSADGYDGVCSKMSELAKETLNLNTNSANGLGMFKDSLRELGASTDDLASLSESDMQSVADAYDGSAASIVGALGDVGVHMDEKKVAIAEAAKGIADALNGVDGAAGALEGTGVSVDEFAQKCADAGLTTEDFAGMSADSFKSVLDACDGDIGKAIETIGLYNSVPLVDKDGTVNVDDARLYDAMGNVYTWNGTALVDKYGNAAVDDTSVTDATGTVWTWNGTALVSKGADATVVGNAVTGDAAGNVDNASAAISRLSDKYVTVEASGNASDGSAATNIWNTVAAIGQLAGRTVTNFVNTIFSEQHNARGGFRPHADGGYRLHASGAIATKATPLDIIGEDGAEAIVPLTNRKYAQPFVDMLADGIAQKGAAQVNNYNFYGDLKALAMDGEQFTKELVALLYRWNVIKG